jgi:hypothetical protein
MELVTKVKPNINSDDVHPQLSNTTLRHPVDGALRMKCMGLLLVWPACQIMPDNLSQNMQSSMNWAYSVVLILLLQHSSQQTNMAIVL